MQILAGLCRVLLSHAVLPCRARRLGGLCGTYSPLRTLPVPAHAWKSTSPIPSCGISSHCRAVEGSWGSRSAVQQQRDSKGDTALRRALSPGEQERGSVTNSCTGHSDTSAGWARLGLGAVCSSQIPVSFDPADPGLFSFHRHSQGPSVHGGFNLMLGQRQGSWDSSGWRCWLPGDPFYCDSHLFQCFLGVAFPLAFSKKILASRICVVNVPTGFKWRHLK